MKGTAARTQELEAAHLERIRRSTDRLFLWLTIIEYVGGVAAAYILSPKTYVGAQGFLHPHVVIAATLGAVIAIPMVYAIFAWPGTYRTRTIVAVCQMLMSALLIHISGGRIETHFHVFGTLAFLAFYRDWRILVWATIVVAGDHLIRGIYLPASVYGVFTNVEWRFAEHAGWVIFEDVILIASCRRGVAEVRAIAEQQARLEETNASIEAIVKNRTEELKESELQKTTVFENALDGIVTTDADGSITEINPAAEKIFGICRHKVLGSHLASIFSPGHSQDFISTNLRLHASSGRGRVVTQNAELGAVGAGGATIPIEVSIVCVPVHGTTVYTAFVRDISERRTLEVKLAHTNKMESLGQLATGVAHEINTPNQYIGDNVRFVEESFSGMVGLIKAYRDTLADAPLSEEQKKLIVAKERESDLDFALEQIPPALGQALEGVERVGSIIRAMKEFAHPGVESFTMVDLNRVVESTVMVARNEWKYVADVNLDLDPNLPTIQGNQGELSQVMLNLLVNAAQAIEERYMAESKGTIVISTKTDAEHVLLTITDNGCGIPGDIKANIFDPFFTTKGVGVGTGQGLTLSRNIIERHKGEIRVKSRVGVGTKFEIRLPLGIPQEDEKCA